MPSTQNYSVADSKDASFAAIGNAGFGEFVTRTELKSR